MTRITSASLANRATSKRASNSRRSGTPHTPLTPDEHGEQVTLFQLADLYRPYVRALCWLYHIPNGYKRDLAVGVVLKEAGVKAGVADLALDWPMPRDPDDPGPDGSGWYHGAKLELKRVGGDKPTGDQLEYLLEMHARGYFVACGYGCDHLWSHITDYLWLDMPSEGLMRVEARPGAMERWSAGPKLARPPKPPKGR